MKCIIYSVREESKKEWLSGLVNLISQIRFAVVFFFHKKQICKHTQKNSLPQKLWASATAQASWRFSVWRRCWAALFRRPPQTLSAHWPLQPPLRRRRLPSPCARPRSSSDACPRIFETGQEKWDTSVLQVYGKSTTARAHHTATAHKSLTHSCHLLVGGSASHLQTRTALRQTKNKVKAEYLSFNTPNQNSFSFPYLCEYDLRKDALAKLSVRNSRSPCHSRSPLNDWLTVMESDLSSSDAALRMLFVEDVELLESGILTSLLSCLGASKCDWSHSAVVALSRPPRLCCAQKSFHFPDRFPLFMGSFVCSFWRQTR